MRLVSRRALLAYPIAASLATRVARADVATPLRARYMPGADLYAPASALEANRAYDLLVHFHGEPAWVEPPVERARLGAVVVTVNLGEGSGVFEAAFKSPRALDALLASTQRAIDASGRAPGARLGRIALSGWSAGFGAVGAVLAQPELAERIDAVLLQDGLHTSYVGAFVPDDRVLAKYARYAERAMRGERLFVFTHSSVRAPGYASTTECARALLKALGIERGPATSATLHGARELYEAHRADFHVKGFDGGSVDQHRDHVRYMDETMLPYLRARWAR